jgi:Flp pilus assembly protein TadG
MIRRLAQLLVRPRKGRDAGAVAVQFAFLAMPLIVLSFGLVDVNRASSEKKRLQDALDAATLTAARSSAVTNADLKIVGDKSLNANLAAMSDATLLSSNFTVNSATSTVTGVATAKVTPIIANLWLNGDMTVGATSDVVRSVNKLEVAMVLDTTGSMAGSKLTNLKTAAKNFIDTLAAAAARSTEVNPVKIGIVPFANAVRLASDSSTLTTYAASTWMDKGTAPIGADIFNGKTGVNRFTLFSNMGQTWAGCVESRAMPYDVQETAPSTGTPATLITPYFWPDEADTDNNADNDYRSDGSYTNESGTSSTDWKRRQGYSAKYNGAPSSSSKGPNRGCSMQPMMRLSTDWTSLKARVDALNASGETHIPLGLEWGWHLLSPNGPFGDGVAYTTPKTSKVVVLMTDGENTYTDNNSNNGSAYDGYAYIWNNRMGTTSSNESTRTTQIDSRLTTLCTNMKAAGVIIYTVRVEVTSGSSSLLQNCATKPEFFYDVQSASNLDAVFSAIAGSIENLRLSK